MAMEAAVVSKKTYKAIMRNIGYLTQLGFSIAFPMIVCTMGSLWLQKRFAMGTWVVFAGVIFGLVSGISCFATFVRHVMREANRKDD